MSDSPLPEQQGKKQPAGPGIAVFVIVLLFVLGGIYFFVTQEMKLHNAPAAEQYNS